MLINFTHKVSRDTCNRHGMQLNNGPHGGGTCRTSSDVARLFESRSHTLTLAGGLERVWLRCLFAKKQEPIIPATPKLVVTSFKSSVITFPFMANVTQSEP